MMVNVATTQYTRKLVLRAIRQLSRQHERITYEDIAERADVSYSTVRRAVKELVAEQHISFASKGKGFGYIYEVKCKR